MSTKRILVCDDEPHIVHVLAAKLRNAGLEVITASDGQEGFELAKQHVPDLVFTDYQMPYLSGVELCAKLQEEPTTRRIPVVMLTARGFSFGDTGSPSANVRRVLVKPFSPREVLRVALEILQGRASSVEKRCHTIEGRRQEEVNRT